MINTEDSMLPPSRKNGWIIVFVLLALLGIAGLVLSILYRDSAKPGEVIRNERRKAAKHVVYTIVLSRIDATRADRIIREIVQDIGPDTAFTDLIIGSPVTDPWCASIREYQRSLRKAMTETKTLPIGTQSVVVSMVGGLLTKNELPARVYLVGQINSENIGPIASRTERTADAFELRSNIMGSVELISYLSPPEHPANDGYVKLFEGKTFKVERRP